jgi:hypothetical protein
LRLVHDATAEVANDPQDLAVGLDELCRLAAQDMSKVALLAERRAYRIAGRGAAPMVAVNSAWISCWSTQDKPKRTVSVISPAWTAASSSDRS